jgi:hypothetical protein
LEETFLTVESYKNPSQIAFENLKELVSKDENLDRKIVIAILEDISSSDPHKLQCLKNAIIEKRGEMADDSITRTQSK